MALRSNLFDFERVESMLSDEYLFLYKFHPLLGDVKVNSSKAINVNEEEFILLY